MGKLMAYLGGDAAQVDAEEFAAKVADECPQLLQPNESIVLAFVQKGGKGRDDFFFTNLRLLLRDKSGLTGKQVEYKSVPYSSIKCFSVQTAGTFDNDTELEIDASGIGRIKLEFMKKVDIFTLKRHLSRYVLAGDRAGANVEGGDLVTDSKVKPDSGGFLKWFGDNHTQISPAKVEEQLRSSTNILLPSERIELAFQVGRDSFLLTSHRIVRIDVKGTTGKKTEFLTILWKCVRMFSLETAGKFDKDSELTIFTNIDGMTRLNIDFRKGKADIFAIQSFFANKLLGMDTVDPSESAKSAKHGFFGGSGGGLTSMFGDNNSMIDARKADEHFHSKPNILQRCERVEMAFKSRRDTVLLTSKRLILIDYKGMSGKKVEFTSIPWTTVQAFGVSTAGSFDRDSEVMLWTDIDDVLFPNRENDNDPPPPPIPRNSFIEIDFVKGKVDVMAIKRYLAERCLRAESGDRLPSDVPVSPDVIAASKPSAMKNFVSWLGDDARAVDPAKLNTKLHEGDRVLQAKENVVLAYKCGRDTLVFTDERVLIIDKHTDKSVDFLSFPYTSIRAFAVESAGGWDKDAEVRIFCKTYWMNGAPGNVIKQDLRKGKADTIAIQNLLAAKVIGRADASSSLEEGATSSGAGAIGNFMTWISDDGVETDAVKVNEKLHTSPRILLPNESVDAAYKVGRDLVVFSTTRVLYIDVQGMSGKKVEYKSYPLRHCKAFKVESAGMMSAAQATIFTDVPGASKIKQELRKGSNIWTLHGLLSNKILEK
mmetsp:Transcript_30726/g.68037  ORF Transcript_30726/g.68037 Transcript_30726/m.68037 type:complete len:766 (+) Transcript_30726:217-2514(+)